MQIIHNGKTYLVIHPDRYDRFYDDMVLRGVLELIETKPEEKPTYWYIETEEMKKSEYWEVFKEWFIKRSGCKNYDFSFGCYGYDENWYSSWEKEEDIGNYIIDKLSPQQWYDTIYDGEKSIKKKYPMYITIGDNWCKGKYEIETTGKYSIQDFIEILKDNMDIEEINAELVSSKYAKPDHDKAMEIPEVPPFNTDIYKEWETEVDMVVGYGKHLHLLTNSLNAVIKKINNL